MFSPSVEAQVATAAETFLTREGNPMPRRAWMVVMLFGAPLIGFLVAGAVRGHQDEKLRTFARDSVPDVDLAKVAVLTVADLCAEAPGVAGKQLCDDDAMLSIMRQGAVWAALAGLALIVGIGGAGRLARRNRWILVILFRPGLYAAVAIAVGLVAVHAALLVGSIWYGESALVGRVHGGVMLAIALGAVMGIIGMSRGAFSIVRRAESTVIGRRLTRTEAPQLWAVVTGLARRLQALEPQNIVVGLDPSFFVTEADVICLDGKLTGRTLYCSMPLSRILRQPEFDAIIGHELAHYKGDDTKFSLRFYPIYRGTSTALASLEQAGGEGAGTFALLPALAVLTYFMECFAVAESTLGRDREIEADRAGANLTSVDAMATALVKVHAFVGVWSGFDSAAAEALKAGKYYTNASELFAGAVATSATAKSLEGLADSRMSHPTDSHPPLAVRLAALNSGIDRLAPMALNVAPEDSAIDYIADAVQRETDLSSAYQGILAHRLGIEVPSSDSDKTTGVQSQ